MFVLDAHDDDAVMVDVCQWVVNEGQRVHEMHHSGWMAGSGSVLLSDLYSDMPFRAVKWPFQSFSPRRTQRLAGHFHPVKFIPPRSAMIMNHLRILRQSTSLLGAMTTHLLLL